LSELSSLALIAKRDNVKKLLSTEIERLSQRKNNLSKQLKEQTNSEEKTSQQTVKQSLGSVIVTNYMWDQDNDFVKIYIEIDKNYSLEKSMIELNFPTKKSFSIIFGKYKFTISKLHSDIDNEKSYYKLTKSGRLIIYLKKVSPKQWTSINEEENAYKKALENEKEELSGDPSAGLMKLMVNISKNLTLSFLNM